jgi:hypothetical protein
MSLDLQEFKKSLLRFVRSCWDGVAAALIFRRFLGDLYTTSPMGWATLLLRRPMTWSWLEELPLPSTLLDKLLTSVSGIFNATAVNVTAVNAAVPGYGSEVNGTIRMRNLDAPIGVKPFQVRVWLDDSSRLQSRMALWHRALASRRQQIVRQSCSLAASAKGWL